MVAFVVACVAESRDVCADGRGAPGSPDGGLSDATFDDAPPFEGANGLDVVGGEGAAGIGMSLCRGAMEELIVAADGARLWDGDSDGLRC